MRIKEHYFVKLIGTRHGWPENMTSEEERIMGEHYEYLKDLTAQKKVLMAGPVFGDVFGMIVLEVNSLDEVEMILKNEPSVLQGVHTYKISPMKASLMAYKIPPFRYPDKVNEKTIHKEITVSENVNQVWKDFTTDKGIQSFLAKGSNIDLRIGGSYEIYFDMDAPEGLRGSEDCHILSFIPYKMLSFEWNAPPQFSEQRLMRTQVIIFFEEVGNGQTNISLYNHGYGEGGNWGKVFDYFDKAWEYVLDAYLKKTEI
jgi:uncharacterized protein YndB with AHSA1/START domain/uncharacterized protein YciI